MLIRLANDDLVEYPDELGALVLADPSHGDVPDFSLEELNCVISGVLGMLFKEKMTLEENIERARKYCTMWGNPSDSNMEKALAQIKHYKESIAVADIGYTDRKLVKELYGIQSSSRKFNDDNIIDHVPGSPTKLLGRSENPENPEAPDLQSGGDAIK